MTRKDVARYSITAETHPNEQRSRKPCSRDSPGGERQDVENARQLLLQHKQYRVEYESALSKATIFVPASSVEVDGNGRALDPHDLRIVYN